MFTPNVLEYQVESISLAELRSNFQSQVLKADYYKNKILGIHRGRGTLEKIHSPGNFFLSMHTQKLD